jgi:hypothetical protein
LSLGGRRKVFFRARCGLGRELINAQPQPDRCKLNEGEIVCREFVIASRDPTTVLDLIEEPFDQISGAVKIWAEADRLVAIASRRDVGPNALLGGKGSDPVGIVTTVGQQH